MPEFYVSVISSHAYMQSKTKLNSMDAILNESIFGNNIRFRYAPLWFESFSKCGFRKVKDIWNTTHKTFYDENTVFNRLFDKSNWRYYYRTIKSCIPREWVEILQLNNTHANSKLFSLNLKDNIYMYDFKNEFIQPTKLSNSQIQGYIRDIYKPNCETKWETYFGETCSWRNIWKMSLDLPCSNKEKQLHWKIIHNALFTESRLQLMGMSNGMCHLCKTDTETLCHLFYHCRVSYSLILKVERALNVIRDEFYVLGAIRIQLKHTIYDFHIITIIYKY